MTVMPYVGYVSILTVDHDDVEEDTGLVEYNVMSGKMRPHVQRQGIAAGIVASVGEQVPIIQEGFKVYYAEQSGIRIDDVTIVQSHYIVAYEEV